MNNDEAFDLASFFSTYGAPRGLASLVHSPWCLDASAYQRLMGGYATHMQGPKVNFKRLHAMADGGVGVVPFDMRRGVAVLHLEGILTPKPTLFTRLFGGVALSDAAQRLKEVAAMSGVKAIVLDMDSPGGSVYGTPELAALVEGAALKKPVVAFTSCRMLSAAYWIGSAANAVYMSGPTCEAGSVGVVMTRYFDPSAGVRSMEFCAGRTTRLESGSERPNAAVIDHLQQRVNYLYGVFVNAVANARGVAFDHASAHMAEGRSFTGQQAVDAGLVDGFMSLDELVDQMATAPHLFAKRRRVRAHLYAAMGKPFSGHGRYQATAAKSTDAAHAYAKKHKTDLYTALKAVGFFST